MLIRYSADSKGKPVQKAVIYTKTEHNISLKSIDPDALYVISRLRENCFDAYIVVKGVGIFKFIHLFTLVNEFSVYCGNFCIKLHKRNRT